MGVDESNYENGQFKFLRIPHCDETDLGGPRFGDVPAVLRVELGLRRDCGECWINCLKII